MQYDDRITKAVRGTDHITLTCRNHPELAWSTKNIAPIGCRSFFFDGEWPRTERSKMSTEGMIPSRKYALQMLSNGAMLDRSDPTGETYLLDTPATRKMVNDRYDELEQKYAFECACSSRDLILHPRYADMPDIDA